MSRVCKKWLIRIKKTVPSADSMLFIGSVAEEWSH